jgi:hypothetical protein
MKNLENFGVQELNAREIKETDGGLMLGRFKIFKKALEWIGVFDAIDDFTSGFSEGNSGSCPC